MIASSSSATKDVHLSVPDHCIMAMYILEHLDDTSGIVYLIMKMFPASKSNLPIFWEENDLSQLQESFLSQQIIDRKVSLFNTYLSFRAKAV
jgi:hypothetical protein